MKQKRIQPGKTEIPAQKTGAPAAGADDPQELKEFVQNFVQSFGSK